VQAALRWRIAKHDDGSLRRAAQRCDGICKVLTGKAFQPSGGGPAREVELPRHVPAQSFGRHDQVIGSCANKLRAFEHNLHWKKCGKPSYTYLMRWAVVLAVCALGLATSGCFNPKVASGGFACSPTDNPACPSGFYCVNGLCLDHPGPEGGGANDLSVGGADFTPPGPDMTQTTNDLSHSGPPDMACYPFGYPCGGDATCCAQCCVGGCTVLGYCAAF
jgi:hypothetical protein